MADPTQPTSSRPPFITATPGPVSPPGTPIAVPPAHWDAIVADLSDRGVTGTPELVSARAVTWNNGALGCPKPGISYTQALVDGMQVIVDRRRQRRTTTVSAAAATLRGSARAEHRTTGRPLIGRAER